MSEPTLFDYLDAMTETIEKVAPNLLDKAHPAGDLVVQNDGHFVMASTPDASGRLDRCQQSVWVFYDLGPMLGVVTCAVHGNTIDPARARALGQHLIAWADRKDGAA